MAGLLFIVLAGAAGAAEYRFDGDLGPGDPQDAEFATAGAYYDTFPFEADAGDEIRFAVRAMTVRPYVIIYDQDLQVVYSTTSVYGNDMDVDWKVEAGGSYTFVLTSSYKQETAYQLTISDLPAGTVVDYDD